MPEIDVVMVVNSELEKIVSGPLEDAMKRIDVDGEVWHSVGIRTPVARGIASRTLRSLKRAGLSDVDSALEAAEQLLSTRVVEHRTVAFQWARSFNKSYEPRHFEVFETWLKDYVTGWGSCDDLCVGALGMFLFDYPAFITEVKKWALSDQPMTRRASAVALVYSLRRGQLGEHCYEIADQLLNDPHYLVLKGYGWMLKEATKHYEDEVFRYIMKRKRDMPRLALRYAIEKMPENLKKQAMRKE